MQPRVLRVRPVEHPQGLPGRLGLGALSPQPRDEPLRQRPLGLRVERRPLGEVGDVARAGLIGAAAHPGAPHVHPAGQVILDVEVDLDVGDRDDDGPAARARQIHSGADHFGPRNSRRQLLARLLRGQPDLGQVLLEERRVMRVQRGQRLGGGDAQVPQRQPLPDVEPALGDRGGGLVGAHLLRAPLLVGARVALVLPDGGDQRGIHLPAGALGDPQTEAVLVVVALEQRPAFPARAAGPGKGLDRRRLQVVPHEHPVGVVAVRRHPAGAQHGAP